MASANKKPKTCSKFDDMDSDSIGDSDWFSTDSDEIDSAGGSNSEDEKDNLDISSFVETVIESKENQWSTTPEPMLKLSYPDVPGLKISLTDKNRPIDYFNLLLDEDILVYVCEKTNELANELTRQPGLSPKSRISQWKPLTVEELKIFVGITLHTGTIQLHRLNDYWRTDKLFNIPIFGHNMPRNRFLIILKCLNFGNGGPSHYDKIAPILEHYNNKMNTIYIPGRCLTLDDSIVLYRGRLISKKLVKRRDYGINIYTLTEHDGLVLKLHVHNGAVDATEVTLTMINERLNKGHAIYLDKCYTSVEIARTLLQHNTHCTGLLSRKRTNNPTALMMSPLQKGENVSLYCDYVQVGKWKKNHDVLYITTEHEDKMTYTIHSDNERRQKPDVIAKNMHFMQSIDRQGLLTSHYPCDYKQLRWTKKVFIHLLQICLFTAHRLYVRHSKEKITWYEFRLAVISQLLTKNISKTKLKLPTSNKLPKIEEQTEKKKVAPR